MTRTYKSILLITLAVIGCADSHAQEFQPSGIPAQVPGHWEQTPAGTTVWVPEWLDLYPDMKTNALLEIDNTPPDTDSRISEGTIGAPIGATVIIQDPGYFSTVNSSTGLASGMTDMRTTIWVSWKTNCTSGVYLPALAHEYRHWYTQDRCAGHTDCNSEQPE